MRLLEKKQIWKTAVSGAAAVLCAGALSFSSYAGTWVQDEAETWYYVDENGQNQTGWVQDTDTGLWYLLDEETGAWIERPYLDNTAAEYLLMNAVKKAGYYQNEENEVTAVVTDSTKGTIYASVRELTGPNSYTNLNNYEIDRRTGRAVGTKGTNVDLY